MSLIQCKSCGREVARNARACPGCGAPVGAYAVAKQFKDVGCGLVALAFLAVLVIVVLGAVFG
jgi:hypothetical protein